MLAIVAPNVDLHVNKSGRLSTRHFRGQRPAKSIHTSYLGTRRQGCRPRYIQTELASSPGFPCGNDDHWLSSASPADIHFALPAGKLSHTADRAVKQKLSISSMLN